MASLTTIHVADIVEVDVKGRRAFGLVTDKKARSKGNPARLVIAPITSGFNWREVTAHQVINHYRKTKNTRKISGTHTKSNGDQQATTGHDAAR